MNKISIIVPVYNVANYIEKCLESILNQKFDDLEIILVEDCSTDDSLEICKRYDAEYDCIKLIVNRENGGLSHARNVGINACTGKYLWFIDSDDYIAPNSLRELYEVMEKNNPDGILFDCERLIEGIEARKKYGEFIVKDNPFQENVVLSGKEIFKGFHAISNYKIEAWRYFWKTEFIKSNRLLFYNGLIGEDNLFGFLALMKSDRIIYKKAEYYKYRMRDGSLMYDKSERRVQSMYIIMSQIYHYWFANEELCKDIKKEISDYILQFRDIILAEKKSFSNMKELSLGNDAEKFAYQHLVIQDDNKKDVFLSEEIIDLLKKKKKIIVYGAGRYGRIVTKELEENELKYEVAVTEREYDISVLNNHYIYTLDELKCFAREATVIIAVGKKNSIVMKEIAIQAGFSDFVLLN